MQVTVRFVPSRTTRNNLVYEIPEGNPHGFIGTLYVPKRLAGKNPVPFYEFSIEVAEAGD